MVKHPHPPSSSTNRLSPEDKRLWERVKSLTKPLSFSSRDPNIPVLAHNLQQTKPSFKKDPYAICQNKYPVRSSLSQEKSPVSSTLASTTPKLSIHQHTLKKITKKHFQFCGVLDLHGHTIKTAYSHFKNFIQENADHNRRIFLIITGKGKGYLKKALVEWCEHGELSPLISSISQAASFHGGEGAFYVILKKRRY